MRRPLLVAPALLAPSWVSTPVPHALATSGSGSMMPCATWWPRSLR